MYISEQVQNPLPACSCCSCTRFKWSRSNSSNVMSVRAADRAAVHHPGASVPRSSLQIESLYKEVRSRSRSAETAAGAEGDPAVTAGGSDGSVDAVVPGDSARCSPVQGWLASPNKSQIVDKENHKPCPPPPLRKLPRIGRCPHEPCGCGKAPVSLWYSSQTPNTSGEHRPGAKRYEVLKIPLF